MAQSGRYPVFLERFTTLPYIIAILGALGVAYFWMMRARGAAEMTSELADAASDVMAAARRFGFRRRYNTHPVDSIEEPNLAIGGIGTAFLELAGIPTTEQKQALQRSLQHHLALPPARAEELIVLGHWFVSECNGPPGAIPRLGKRLYKLTGVEDLQTAMAVVGDVIAAGATGMDDRQREALHDLKRAFRLK